MTDSGFWQGIESQFRALAQSGEFCAHWRYVPSDDGNAQWDLVGNQEARLRFELLARQAGAMLDASGTGNTLFVWLNRLQSRSPNFRHDGDALGQDKDGSIHYVLGRVDGVCEASANLCLEFAVDALKAEERRAQPTTVVGGGELDRRAAVNDYMSDSASGSGVTPIESATVANGDTGTDKRATVDAFLLRCNEEPGLSVKVIRKHVWLAVGHKYPRQFEYWQAGKGRSPGTTSRSTDSDDRNFRRILSMKPADFVALLKKMNILAKP